jgi:hypothetical protein
MTQFFILQAITRFNMEPRAGESNSAYIYKNIIPADSSIGEARFSIMKLSGSLFIRKIRSPFYLTLTKCNPVQVLHRF